MSRSRYKKPKFPMPKVGDKAVKCAALLCLILHTHTPNEPGESEIFLNCGICVAREETGIRVILCKPLDLVFDSLPITSLEQFAFFLAQMLDLEIDERDYIPAMYLEGFGEIFGSFVLIQKTNRGNHE